MKQIVHWPLLFNTITGTQFQTLFGVSPITNGATLEPAVGAPWSVAGTFSNLKVTRNVAPGTGVSAILTLVKNGTPTSLSVTIAHPAVTASDTSNTVTAAAGDTFSIQFTTSGGSPASSYGSINLEFDATDDSESGYCAYAPLLVADTSPQYQGIVFTTWPNVNSNMWYPAVDHPDALSVIPLAGVIERFDVAFRTSGLSANGFQDMASGDAVAFVLTVNGIVQDGTSGTVNTTTTLTHPATSATWSGTLSVAAGDIVNVRAIPTASMVDATKYGFLWSFRFDASTTNRFWLGSNQRTSVITSPEYSAVAGQVTPETIETNGHGHGSVTTWYMLDPLFATGLEGDARVMVSARLNATSPANAPSVAFMPDFASGSLIEAFQVVAVGTAVSPGGSPFTITSADTWSLMQVASTEIRGSAVFGVNTDVTATRAVAFGLDNNTNIMNETGKLKVFGNMDATGYLELQPMTAPAAGTGIRFYLDVADGDLKVVFPNGTVRTIEVN